MIPTCFQDKLNDPSTPTTITTTSNNTTTTSSSDIDTNNTTTTNTNATTRNNSSARIRSILNMFAGGIFLAASMIHLLPDVTENPALASLGCPSADESHGLGFILMVFVDNFAQVVHEQSHNNQEYHHHDHDHDHPLVQHDDDNPQDRIYQVSDPLLPADTNTTSSSYGSNHDIDDNLEHSNISTEKEIRCLNTPQEKPQNEEGPQGCGTDHCLTNHQVYYSLQDDEQEYECVGLLHGTTSSSNATAKYINDNRDTYLLHTGFFLCILFRLLNDFIN